MISQAEIIEQKVSTLDQETYNMYYKYMLFYGNNVFEYSYLTRLFCFYHENSKPLQNSANNNNNIRQIAVIRGIIIIWENPSCTLDYIHK